MDDSGALSEGLETAGVIGVAALAALVLLVVAPRLRALLMLATLVLTPVLLIADIWDTSQIEPFRDHPALAAAAGLAGVGAVVVLAWSFDRRPTWFPLAAVAMVPFRVPIESGGDTSNLLVPLYGVIAAGVLAYVWGVLRGRVGKGRRPGALEWALAVAVLLYGVQAAYSSDTGKALDNVVFFYVPFALLFVLLARSELTPELVRKALAILALLALGFAAVGFVEYATRHVFLNPRVVASNQLESYFRVNSLFFDPNIYGRFLIIVMISATAGMLWTKDRREVWVTAGLLAVLFAALILTLSQSSLASLLAGLAVLAGVKWNLRRTAYAAAGAVALGVVLVVAFGSAIGVDLGDKEELSKDTSGRSELIEGGVGLFTDKPLGGYGSGSYEAEFRERENVSEQRALSASHTIPLTIAAEQGLLGLAAYLALLAVALARLLPSAGSCVIRSGILAGFIALVFHTCLYAAFLEDPLTWLLLGLGTAMAIRRWRTEAEPA